MQRVTLKHTGLTVSRICFGTMTFGKQVDQAGAKAMVDRCLDAGINFFDTANIYQRGEAEVCLGQALGARRQHVVVASKVRGKMGEDAGQSGLSLAAIFRAVEESLKRLRTDYLDIYYLHQPDYAVPIDETLDAMEQLVRQGKVRYPASSNYAAWQVTAMLSLAEKRGFRPACITQPMYNLLARGIEQEYLPMAETLGVSTIVYNPLAGGLLTGKHNPAQPQPGGRFDNNQMYLDRYWHPQYFEAVTELRKVAQRAGRSLISLSLSWLLHHAPIDGVILGASRLDQLNENLQACADGPLPEDALAGCDQVWANLRGVTPKYNR
jgi:1-deoxyxylulose-5-phosphate synthase